MANMMIYTTVFTIINLLLISGLLYVYIQNYRELRATFSLGLIIFATTFLVQKLTSIYLFMVLMLDLDPAVGTSLMILEILQTFAFSVLAWITWK